MSLLLTGASGYLGSRISLNLERAGVAWEALQCRLETLSVGSLKHRVVIHCAGALRNRPDQLQPSNVDGTRALVRALPTGARVVFVSTRSVYPLNHHALTHEGDPVGPWDGYGSSKLAAEQILLASPHKVAVVRTAAIFGHPTRNSTFLDRAVDLAITDQPIDLATPSRLEDYLAVDWLADALVRAALDGSIDGKIVHAAGPPRSLDDIFRSLDCALRDAAARPIRIHLRELPVPATPVLGPGRLAELLTLPPPPTDHAVFTAMINARLKAKHEGRP